MTAPKSGPISADAHLKSLAQRIENLMDERDGIQSDIRDIYAEAKSHGYVPKVLRKAITRKRMEPSKRDEEDAILELYEGALSPSMRKAAAMAKAGATSREIEEETGIDHATVARSVALNKKSATSSATGNSAHEGEEYGRSNDGNAALPKPQESLGAGDCHMLDGAECAEPGERDGRASGLHDDFRGQGLCADDGRAGRGVEALSATGRLPGDVRRRLPVDQSAQGVSGRLHEAVAGAGRGVDPSSTPPLGAVAEAQPERVASTEIDLTPPAALLAKRKEIDQRRTGT